MTVARLFGIVTAALLVTACGPMDPAGSLLDSPGPGFTQVTSGAEPADLDDAAAWLGSAETDTANRTMLADAGFRRGYEKIWTQRKPAEVTPTIKAMVPNPIWLLVKIRLLEVRDGQSAANVLNVARRNDESNDLESIFAVPGLASAYGTSYPSGNGANVVQIVYAQGRNVFIVQTVSMQRWIGIGEAVGYAKQQHAAVGDNGWPTRYLVVVAVAGLLVAGSVPAILIVLRRRRTTPANDPPAADATTPKITT